MFWQTLIKLCNEHGTKPNPLAKELGISSGSITKWKNGAIPHDTTLQKIADYFNVSVAYLKGETDQKEPPATESDEQLMEAWELFNRLDAEAQSQALKYLAFLTETSQKP